uniref:Uncharacterized protein LOC114344393 n=1 Tax=Diabrotica virgifera virgifera TaxID=50390 RepID=A0A6P7GZX1_DIAVI
MPFPSRHFETCIVGSKAFFWVVRDIGQFRKIQSNMFWYDYKTDEWSQQYKFPIADKSYKCCNYLDTFLILSIDEMCAFLFKENRGWRKLKLAFPPLEFSHDIRYIQTQYIISKYITEQIYKYTLFAYKDRLYLKGVV